MPINKSMAERFVEQIPKAFLTAIIWGSLFYFGTAFADDPATTADTADTVSKSAPSLTDLVNRFSQDIPSLMRLVTALAYVMGMWFVIKGVNGLKLFGEQRTMMSGDKSINGPIIMLVVGAMLLYLPTTVNMSMHSLWDNPVPFAYKKDAEDPWSILLSNSLLILQLIGTIAFIRGLIIMTHLGGQGGQQGQFGKAMAHIIGGVLCINMNDTITTVLTSFGLNNYLQ